MVVYMPNECVVCDVDQAAVSSLSHAATRQQETEASLSQAEDRIAWLTKQLTDALDWEKRREREGDWGSGQGAVFSVGIDGGEDEDGANRSPEKRDELLLSPPHATAFGYQSPSIASLPTNPSVAPPSIAGSDTSHSLRKANRELRVALAEVRCGNAGMTTCTVHHF